MFGKSGVTRRMMIAVSAVVVMYAGIFVLVGLSLSDLTRDARQNDQQSLPYILLADQMNLSRLEVQQSLATARAVRDSDGYKNAGAGQALYGRC